MPLAGEILTASVLSIGIPNGSPPINTSTAGTATSGSTETFDAILGYYQFTAINGHTYQAILNGLLGNGSVVGDTYTIQIRDSGNSSNPTSGSLLVAQAEWEPQVTGSGGRISIPDSYAYVASGSGVHTLGVSAVRLSGTGIFTPVGIRQLYVVDLGGN
jgi:hypothetical protein